MYSKQKQNNNNTNKQINNYMISNKYDNKNIINNNIIHHYQSNSDLDWLQKIVNSFQLYKFQFFNNNYQQILQKNNQQNIYHVNNLFNQHFIHNNQLQINRINNFNKLNSLQNINKNQKNKQDINANFVKKTKTAKRVSSQTSAVQKKQNSNGYAHKYQQYKRQKSLQSDLFNKNSPSILNSTLHSQSLNNSFITTNPTYPKSLNNTYTKKHLNIKSNKQHSNLFLNSSTKTFGKIIKNTSLDHHHNKQQTPYNNQQQKYYCNHNHRKYTSNSINKPHHYHTQQHQNKQQNTQQINKSKLKQILKKQKQHQINYQIIKNLQKCHSTFSKLNQFNKISKNHKNNLQFYQSQSYLSNYIFKDNYKQQTKKQRKLNTSFGQRKSLPQHELPLSKSIKKQRQHTEPTYNTQTTLDNIPIQKLDNNQLNTDQTPNTKTSTINQPITKSHPQLTSLDNRYVKYVQSTKSSFINTQHSLVVDKQPPLTIQLQHPKNQQQQQQNILDIFNQLDGKKLGILNSNNCYIQNVNRYVRCIFGKIFQEIMYHHLSFNFQAFVERTQKYLSFAKTQNQSQLLNHKIQQQKQNNCAKKQQQNSIIYQQKFNSNDNHPTQQKYQNDKKCSYQKNQSSKPVSQQQQNPNPNPIRFSISKTTSNSLPGQAIPILKDRSNTTTSYPSQNPPQQLTSYKPPLKFIQTTRSTHRTQLTSSSTRKIGSQDTYKDNYQNQFIKLQVLNNKLSKYLNKQNSKSFTNKLRSLNIN